MDDDKVKWTRTTGYLRGTRPRQGFDGDSECVEPLDSPPLGCRYGYRLSWFPTPKLDYDPAKLADLIGGAGEQVGFFCDSSLFDDHTNHRIWEALLSKTGRVFITPLVYRELQPWMSCHPDHVATKAIEGNAEAIRFADIDRNSEIRLATFNYYVHLLAIRKMAFKLLALQFEEEHGRPPTNNDLMSIREQAHNRGLGPRGYLMAKKGAADSGSPNFYTDEFLVVSAVMAGIYKGLEIVILTKDEDLQEQLYKLLWLIDTHYRGMLLADLYVANPGRFVTHAMPKGHPVFAEAFECNGGVLVERSDQQLWEILPSQFTPIHLHCWVVGRKISQLTFCAEAEMRALLTVKGQTRGLNTDKLAGKNLHIWPAPLQVPREYQGCAVIAQDRRVSTGTVDHPVLVEIPILDVNQALNCHEHYKRFAHRMPN